MLSVVVRILLIQLRFKPMSFVKSDNNSKLFLMADGSTSNTQYVSEIKNLASKTSTPYLSSTYGGYIQFDAIKIGSYVIGFNVKGYIKDTVFTGSASANKLTYTLDTKFRPLGPVILTAETRRGNSTVASTHLWIDSSYIYAAGNTGAVNTSDPDYSGSTLGYHYFNGMYLIDPTTE